MPEYSRHRPGLGDFLLSGLGAMLAVYSGGVGVRMPEIGYVFMVGIIAGTLASWRFAATKFGMRASEVGPYLYAAAGFAAVMLQDPLNSVLPLGGFPRALAYGAALSWMLLVGSWLAWSDNTLLFQAVPAIALFGLVGAWDTFPGVTVLFFVFLLCGGTLFSRAHRRAMLLAADRAGEHDEARLRAGPWKWMAGPAWALFSGALVVCLSVLGAPVLQASARNVSGMMQINVPTRSRGGGVIANRYGTGAGQMVGRGPANLRNVPVLRVRMPWPEYLRGAAYAVYNGRGWNQGPNITVRPDFMAGAFRAQQPTSYLKNAVSYPFEVQVLSGAHRAVYSPGELMLSEGSAAQRKIDGTVYFPSQVNPGHNYRARAWFATKLKPTKVGDPVALWGSYAKLYYDPGPVTKRVADLARKVAGTGNDYERALRIQREIERRTMYNINAEALPPNVDAADAFLFNTKEGYCDLFATSMTVMARSIGMPARYATGFAPSRRARASDGSYTIFDTEAHAWCEIYFEGVGWVRFDPTSGARAVPGGGVGSTPNNSAPWYLQPWMLGSLDWSIVAVGGALLLVMGHLALSNRRRSAHGPSAGRLLGLYERAIGRSGVGARRSHETLRAFTGRAMPLLSQSSEQVSGSLNLLERALYGPPADAEANLALEQRLRALDQELRSKLRK